MKMCQIPCSKWICHKDAVILDIPGINIFHKYELVITMESLKSNCVIQLFLLFSKSYCLLSCRKLNAQDMKARKA